MVNGYYGRKRASSEIINSAFEKTVEVVPEAEWKYWFMKLCIDAGGETVSYLSMIV